MEEQAMTITIPEHSVPVLHECDVLVCGGGCAGIAAAIAAQHRIDAAHASGDPEQPAI